MISSRRSLSSRLLRTAIYRTSSWSISARARAVRCFFFIEVVASDGPVTPQRQDALLKIATDAGFPANRVAFVTAFLDRSHPAFKKAISELAWHSFAWFAAEP